MAPQKNETIQLACERFRADWTPDKCSAISDYVSQVPAKDHDALVALLIAADIEMRQKHANDPESNEYTDYESNSFTDTSVDLNSVSSLPPAKITAMHGSLGNDEENKFSFSDAPKPTTSAKAGQTIGRYKLLQLLGRGGMGAVWMAEQSKPVKRRVALKLIRADIGSKSAIPRFEAERQAIAMMDHQNIAKILDAGTTEDGRPYFVMELVAGIPLNQYCDKHRLGIRERLQLMIPICRAIQHAHQKAIIHRDLKHSNVLVTECDGVPVPKVIDFGLAKALGHQGTLTDKTVYTEIGSVVGTLQYMSPEQAESSNVDIDTRSDVYSLGVMIFKLLTGGTPLQADDVSEISLLDALQQIRDKDPIRPSNWVKSNEESVVEVCKLRNIEPEKLETMLKGDLDWIVLTALAKNRNERYQTANALAMEIERYLNNEKVLARPPTIAYSVRKFVRRNRGLVASLAGFAILLISGIFATSYSTYWALKERNRANSTLLELKIETANALKAEKAAKAATQSAQIQLKAFRLNRAWADWQLGKIESAWQMLNMIDDEDSWESRFLRSEFSPSKGTLYGHSRTVTSVDVSRNGNFIVTGALDDSVKLWNAKTYELIHTWLVEDTVANVRFSPDSRAIACVDRSNVLNIWDVMTFSRVVKFGPFERDLSSVAYSPDGSQLIVGESELDSTRVAAEREIVESSTPVIHVFALNTDGDSYTAFPKLEGHEKAITNFAWAPNGESFLSSSLDNTVGVWRKEDNGFRLDKTIVAHDGGVNGVAYSPLGNVFATCGSEGLVKIWNVETGTQIRSMAGHTDFVKCVSFSADGKRILSCSSDRTAKVWSIEGEELLSCQGHYSTVMAGQFFPDGETIVTVSDDHTARVWNSKIKTSTSVFRNHEHLAWSTDFSPDDKRLVSVSEDGTIVMRYVETGEIIGVPIQLDNAQLSVAFTPDGKYFVAGEGVVSTDGSIKRSMIRVWDSKNLTLLKTIDAHADFVWGIDFSPDGKFMVSASADKTLKVWNTNDWTLVKGIVAHDKEIASVRYSPDGTRLVTASDDRTVKLWDAETIEEIRTFHGHTDACWRAVFSPDGNLIASSSYNGNIILWESETGQKMPSPKNAHTDQVAGLDFSADGTRLVSASDDETIMVWDVKSGHALFEMWDKGDTPIVVANFSHDGSKLVTANADGWVTIRSAGKETSRPFLPQDAVKISNFGKQVVMSKDVTRADFEKQLESSTKTSNYFPSYETFTIRGISQYRLGKYSDAVKSLIEAKRLEIIQYDQPDIRPNIEGYLAMSFWKVGEEAKARKQRMEFDELRKAPMWATDDAVTRLAKDVESVIGR